MKQNCDVGQIPSLILNKFYNDFTMNQNRISQRNIKFFQHTQCEAGCP